MDLPRSQFSEFEGRRFPTGSILVVDDFCYIPMSFFSIKVFWGDVD